MDILQTRPVEPALATYSAKQTVEVMAAGPALNTNGKPRARRGSATDPQSVYARVKFSLSGFYVNLQKQLPKFA